MKTVFLTKTFSITLPIRNLVKLTNINIWSRGKIRNIAGNLLGKHGYFFTLIQSLPLHLFFYCFFYFICFAIYINTIITINRDSKTRQRKMNGRVTTTAYQPITVGPKFNSHCCVLDNQLK